MSTTTCAHPTCSGAPAAWLAYDYEGRCAWLDDQPIGSGRAHQWPLCRRHADNLRVPRGWFCIDRRATRRWEGWVGWEGPGTADGPGPTSAPKKGTGRARSRGPVRGPATAEGAESALSRAGQRDVSSEDQREPRVTAIL